MFRTLCHPGATQLCSSRHKLTRRVTRRCPAGDTSQLLWYRADFYSGEHTGNAARRRAFVNVYMKHIYGWVEQALKTAKLFKNGDSQAVRLPKEFRFSGTEVWIRKCGDAVVLLPRVRTWRPLIESLGKFTPDFMADRDQPPVAEEREPF